MAFVTKIKEYRAKLNMTQEDLAKQVGVRRETISHLEKENIILPCSLLTILRGHFIVRLMKFLFLRMNKNTGILLQRIPVFFIYTTITHTKPHEIRPTINIDPLYNPDRIHSSQCNTYLPQDEYSNLRLHSLFVITFPSQK